jgi:hypothetical protein
VRPKVGIPYDFYAKFVIRKSHRECSNVSIRSENGTRLALSHGRRSYCTKFSIYVFVPHELSLEFSTHFLGFAVHLPDHHVIHSVGTFCIPSCVETS